MFGPLIRRYLLQNTHKVTVELLPDAKLGAQVEQDEKARLKVLHLAKASAAEDPRAVTAICCALCPCSTHCDTEPSYDQIRI